MKATEKIDLYKQYKEEYATPKKPVLLNLKKAVYLAIDGQGEPGGEVFQDRIGALYSVAFTVKMTRKFGGQQDYTICKLEALWGCDGCESDFSRLPKEQWRWKMLIRTPEFVQPAELDTAVTRLLEKGKPPSVREVRLETITEGQCVQMLHVGPYERENETVEVMKSFAAGQGLRFHGRHHEIYLSDPRRVAPEKLKTTLRMPVTKNSAA